MQKVKTSFDRIRLMFLGYVYHVKLDTTAKATKPKNLTLLTLNFWK